MKCFLLLFIVVMVFCHSNRKVTKIPSKDIHQMQDKVRIRGRIQSLQRGGVVPDGISLGLDLLYGWLLCSGLVVGSAPGTSCSWTCILTYPVSSHHLITFLQMVSK